MSPKELVQQLRRAASQPNPRIVGWPIQPPPNPLYDWAADYIEELEARYAVEVSNHGNCLDAHEWAMQQIGRLEAELTQSEKWRIGMTAALVEVMTIMGDDMTHPPTVITPEDMIRLAKEWRKDYDEALVEGL